MALGAASAADMGGDWSVPGPTTSPGVGQLTFTGKEAESVTTFPLGVTVRAFNDDGRLAEAFRTKRLDFETILPTADANSWKISKQRKVHP